MEILHFANVIVSIPYESTVKIHISFTFAISCDENLIKFSIKNNFPKATHANLIFCLSLFPSSHTAASRCDPNIRVLELYLCLYFQSALKIVLQLWIIFFIVIAVPFSFDFDEPFYFDFVLKSLSIARSS